MSDKSDNNFDEFLSPEILRGKLVAVSLFITTFEIFRYSTVDRVKSFYDFGSKAHHRQTDNVYSKEVLSKNKRVLKASLLWLKEHNAINNADIITAEKIILFRNKLIHELPQFIFGGADAYLTEAPLSLKEILSKIEKWWVINLELPSNTDFDGVPINDADIVTGSLLALHMIEDIATGDEKKAYAYLSAFQKQIKHN